MKIIKAISLLILILCSVNIAFGQDSSKTSVPGELLVKFRDGTASEAARTSHVSTGASILEEFPTLGWQRIKLPAGLSIERAITKYKRLEGVEYVQPNYYYHLLATPNDPMYPQSGMYGLGKISAPSAWDLSTGSSSVVVADIDTGLRYTHQDLAANTWTNTGETINNGIDDDGNGFVDDYYGYDFRFNDPDPFDELTGFGGHGTHTAGTIGAVGNNSIGVTGINWNVKIMAIKIYNASGSDTTSAMLINAYNYVTMMKNRGVNIRATNNSYGGCQEACGYDQATKDAIDAMGNAGILNIFAAGNSGTNNDAAPHYPSSYTSPSLVAVAGSNASDTNSFNFGLSSVDLAAPGVGILSTISSSDTAYGTKSGTSMATPHVTGATALLSAFNPSLSAASLKASILNNVDVIPSLNGLVKTGGRLNVFKAMQNPTVCDFQFSPTTIEFGNQGGNGVQPVTAATNCDYAVRSNVNWITILSGNPGSGNGQFTYSVAPMPIPLGAGFGRSGTISVGDKTLTITQPGAPPPPWGRAVFDYDGDGRTDISAIENVGGQMVWHNLKSANGYTATNFGLFADDIPVTGDFDGDALTDIAVWRNSNGDFYYLHSNDGTFHAVHFGTAGDNPRITQDFDGDGKADPAVTRKENGQLVWYILGSSMGFVGYQFGLENDLPIRGQYDFDNKADLAVYRPAPSNTFFILKSDTGAVTATTFGISTTDTPVPGDYDGDALTDIAVWRSTDGVWYYLKSSQGGAFGALQFGMNGDLPAPGDYDGDGKTDFCVWRPASAPSQGIFYINRSTSGFLASGWGTTGMKIPANSILTP